jgi:hypothetical protein
MIKKIRESDVGVYTCSAKNKEGAAESSGNLEIVEFIEKGRSDAPGLRPFLICLFHIFI